LRKTGRTMLLCGARRQPASMLEHADFIQHIGRDNILPHVQAALDRAREIHAQFDGVGAEAARDFETAPL
jgi:sulfate permease, SulP family